MHDIRLCDQMANRYVFPPSRRHPPGLSNTHRRHCGGTYGGVREVGRSAKHDVQLLRRRNLSHSSLHACTTYACVTKWRIGMFFPLPDATPPGSQTHTADIVGGLMVVSGKSAGL